MRILFLFLDGVGLGSDDPAINPLAGADMPFWRGLLNGRALTASAAPFASDMAALYALDAGLGVDGLPQSATGQAVLLSGENVPAALGYHYGPKPNPAVAAFLQNGRTLFSRLGAAGKSTALLNAYPPGYFHNIQRGRRLHSAIPLAVTEAGLPLFTQHDLQAGRALSADFTGAGWREMLPLPDTPLLSPRQAGERLAHLAQGYDFSFFEYWLSDYAGHRQDMDWALRQWGTLDEVLAGLVEHWDLRDDLILITSDHGNMEDLSTRRHTAAEVPALFIGQSHPLVSPMRRLTDVAPVILRLFRIPSV
ncbi:MAG: metalloenzyme [Anaerolineales bacterium]